MKKAIVEDLYSSYLTFIVKNFVNYGRFQIESICRIKNNENETEYYLLSPVIACNVYGVDQLIKNPPYMFQAIFSKTHYKIFRTYLPDMRSDDNTGLIKENFEDIELDLKRREMVLLKDDAEIIKAARDHRRIQGELVLFDHDWKSNTGDISVDFLVKHINVHPGTGRFQVETGTIALPEALIKSDTEIDQLRICFIAFNTINKVDIVQLPGMKVLSRDCSITVYG